MIMSSFNLNRGLSQSESCIRGCDGFFSAQKIHGRSTGGLQHDSRSDPHGISPL